MIIEFRVLASDSPQPSHLAASSCLALFRQAYVRSGLTVDTQTESSEAKPRSPETLSPKPPKNPQNLESLIPHSASSPHEGRAGQGRAGQGRAGGRAGQGRAGQGRAGQQGRARARAGQGRAGQGRAGQGRAGIVWPSGLCCCRNPKAPGSNPPAVM